MMNEQETNIDFFTSQMIKIMNAMNIDDNVSMLHETDLILKTIPTEYYEEKKIKEIKEEIEKILDNENDMRILKLNTKIKSETETAIEYFDKDIGTDKRLFYKPELEAQILDTQKKVRLLLSLLVKKKDEGIDFG